jgi:AcrR family transcriptional regulator
VQPQTRRRRQRSDARHSIAAILGAAAETLRARPDASVDDIARAAGVSRQTVYAHFPSREALLDAVAGRATTEVTAALDGAGLDQAPPAVALIRLLDAGWQVAARYPFLWHLPAVSPDQDAARHGPVLDRLLEVIRRGQESGDFDRTLPPAWLLTAALALGRAAEDEVKAGRMTIEQASHAVHHSFLRLFGLSDDARQR